MYFPRPGAHCSNVLKSVMSIVHWDIHHFCIFLCKAVCLCCIKMTALPPHLWKLHPENRLWRPLSCGHQLHKIRAWRGRKTLRKSDLFLCSAPSGSGFKKALASSLVWLPDSYRAQPGRTALSFSHRTSVAHLCQSLSTSPEACQQPFLFFFLQTKWNRIKRVSDWLFKGNITINGQQTSKEWSPPLFEECCW